MTNSYPHELCVSDVYFSPILPAIFFAFMAALITVMFLNKMKFSRWFYAPAYVFLAIMTLYMVAIDYYWIKF
jgi:hypothetical protein